MGQILYIVHDLNDPAVTRRVRMLHASGQKVVILGFHRLSSAPTQIDGAPVRSLGRTTDARLIHRATAVLRNFLAPAAIIEAAKESDAIIGRNLEALVLAHRASRRAPGARVVYECLDIHRMLTGSSLASRMIRRLERLLLARTDLLIVSSPAFLRHHFSAGAGAPPPSVLVENKYYAGDQPAPQIVPAPAGPPWTIGWLGNLRCRKTLDVLSALVRRHDGRVRLLVAGRPTTAVFDDLPAELARLPHCTYLGPYTIDQQAEIYARCHFAWAIDWFEEGLNSSWLLPNRLYEAQAFGVVPIALASVETGRWLADRRAGVLLDDTLSDLDAKVAEIGPSAYQTLRACVAAIPREHLITGESEIAMLSKSILAA